MAQGSLGKGFVGVVYLPQEDERSKAREMRGLARVVCSSLRDGVTLCVDMASTSPWGENMDSRVSLVHKTFNKHLLKLNLRVIHEPNRASAGQGVLC